MKKNGVMPLLLALACTTAIIMAADGMRRIMVVHADSNQEVPAYKISDLPKEDGIYKLVHHGCALYIVREHHSDGDWQHPTSAGVSVTTGEGCK
jgi:hypothetical protein